MSYTPHTWVDGETITYQKLNAMEQGIANTGSGALVCTSTYNGEDWVLDKTAGEIYDALVAGTPVFVKYNYGDLTTYSGTLTFGNVVRASNYNYTETLNFYVVKVIVRQIGSIGESGVPSVFRYTANGLDGYPVLSANSNVGDDYMEARAYPNEE